jgi:hypothetical protein
MLNTNEMVSFGRTVLANSRQFAEMASAIREARAMGATRGEFPAFAAFWCVTENGVYVWALADQWQQRPW